MENKSYEEILSHFYQDAYPVKAPPEGFPWKDILPPRSISPVRDLLAANNDLEDALLNPNTTDGELYYAFLRDVIDKKNLEPEAVKDSFNNDYKMMKLDKEVAQNMWREGLEYIKIIRCLTASPSEVQDRSIPPTRWAMSAFVVGMAINPILNEPWTAKAKPVAQLDAFALSEEVWRSYLKHLWQKKPGMSSKEAEKACIQTLHKYGYSENTIRRGFEECSFTFPKPRYKGDELWSEAKYQDYTAAYQKRREDIDAFLSEALGQDKPPEKKKSSEEIDREIYGQMQQKLKNMKPAHETGDLLEYWQQSIKTMKDTLFQLEQAKNTCKVMAIWNIGLERASKELGERYTPEMKSLNRELKAIMEKTEAKERDWDKIYDMMGKMDKFTQTLLTRAAGKRERIPILADPVVQHAKDLTDVIKSGEKVLGSGYHRELLLAAIKKAALTAKELPKELALEAAVSILLEHKVLKYDIQKALETSSRIANLPSGEISLTCHRLISEAQNNTGILPGLRGGGRM